MLISVIDCVFPTQQPVLTRPSKLKMKRNCKNLGPDIFILIHLISHTFYEKRMAAEVKGDALGDEFKGYIFKITGGNDKQGFPMKQGVLLPHRARLLLSKV